MVWNDGKQWDSSSRWAGRMSMYEWWLPFFYRMCLVYNYKNKNKYKNRIISVSHLCFLFVFFFHGMTELTNE